MSVPANPMLFRNAIDGDSITIAGGECYIGVPLDAMDAPQTYIEETASAPPADPPPWDADATIYDAAIARGIFNLKELLK